MSRRSGGDAAVSAPAELDQGDSTLPPIIPSAVERLAQAVLDGRVHLAPEPGQYVAGQLWPAFRVIVSRT